MNSVLRELRRVVLLSEAEGLSDAQLLDAFLAHRDEAAFDALLHRHGPMVLGVCRRVLRNAHDAEDAFQATFLVLARKACDIRSRQAVASWLYGVAYRTAMHARKTTMRRRAKESEMAFRQPSQDGVPEELLAQLDYELSRLPDKYRVPLVLCELEGRNRKEVARSLEVPEGTLSWRLAQAKKLLAQRLSRYGTVAVAALLAEGLASARPSPALLKTTANAVLKAGMVPAQVMSLTHGVLKAMLLTKLKITVCAAGLMLLTGIGATGLTYRATAQQPNQGLARESRPQADDLESLRLEIEALRKELRATRELVKALAGEVKTLKGQGAPAGGGRTRPMLAPANSTPAMRGAAPGGNVAPGGDGIGAAGPSITAPASTAAPATVPPRLRSSGDTVPEHSGPALAPSTAETSRRPKVADPLAEAEAALKKLRRDPSDTEAAEALERALHRLKVKEREKPNLPERKH
jgi:RNA polymerase sigma factor (sigma-70 family)